MRFWEVYLASFLFWTQFSIGSVTLIFIYCLTGGRWGSAIISILRPITYVFSVLVLAFIPLLLGAGDLYPWVYNSTSGYFTMPFFVVRAAIYFLVWIYLAGRARRICSEPQSMNDRRYFCSYALVAMVLTSTFACIDWAISREPHGYSTIYGFIFFIGSLVSAMAYSVVVYSKDPAADLSKFRIFGNLLLTMVLCWAYASLMQYLIVWFGNHPDEISWYVNRTHGGWIWVVVFLGLFLFVAPLILLIFRNLKTNLTIMSMLGILFLTAKFLEIVWVTVPPSRDRLDVAAFDLLFLATIAFPFVYFCIPREFSET